MPYINEDQREYLHMAEAVAENPGQLNYQLFIYIKRYMKLQGRSYKTYAEIEGVLSHISKELYRRSVEPYEEKKMLENGDIFPGEWTR